MATEFEIDWSTLPTPVDDGAADHLTGQALPKLRLPSTDGRDVDLSALDGAVVLYVYPMTGTPGKDLPQGWNDIPGARGCTPQSCAFRDRFAELQAAGATHVFGVSTQTTDAQTEAAQRLHLPFPLLSDSGGALSAALRLPMFDTEQGRHHKRLTLIARNGMIAQVFYPVFPPDADAANVEAWLRAHC
ncbi:peroxiredoxin [Tropicimonas sp. S265A]|uniref:peroxiredoxin n=1 Tax=Tropicimonas sp. S265A TaxID=3415134 RepID=UPI003C7B4DBC